jgi:hypothetical protein
MLTSFRGMMGSAVEATDGSLGNAIRFYIKEDDWSMPLVMVGGGRATTGEIMVPTQMVADVDQEGYALEVPSRRRSVLSSGKELSGGHHGVFDALRLMGASVTARGEPVGKVTDLMVDTEKPWSIKYLVVGSDPDPGREMLFSTEWVSKWDLDGRHADLDVDRADVNDCPDCDLRQGVRREYERQLHEHYNKTSYLGRFG